MSPRKARPAGALAAGRHASAGFSELARRTKEPPISWLMSLALDRPSLISLAAGFTDSETLPVPETEQLLEQILSSPKLARQALQYGSTLGDPALRELTGARVKNQDAGAGAAGGAEAYSPARMLITHGSQQLLYLAAECLCDPGDIVLLEDPTYFVFLGITGSRGLRCRGIPLEADGIDLNALEGTLEQLRKSGGLSRVKMLYLVTYYQNPSTVTTSYEKKKRALEILARYEREAGHPIYLLEDAAYRDLRFAGQDVASALGAGFENRVIYAGTFSKPFATGIRVGFGLMPENVLRAMVRLKGNHDFGTSNLLQQILSRGLQSHLYEEHVKLLQKRYAEKAAVMMEAVREHFPPEAAWLPPEGGLYVWPKLPRRIKTGPKSAVFKEALGKNVLYVPGELCYAEDEARAAPQCEMRLSFGNASAEEMRTGIERLGGILKRAVKKG